MSGNGKTEAFFLRITPVLLLPFFLYPFCMLSLSIPALNMLSLSKPYAFAIHFLSILRSHAKGKPSDFWSDQSKNAVVVRVWEQKSSFQQYGEIFLPHFLFFFFLFFPVSNQNNTSNCNYTAQRMTTTNEIILNKLNCFVLYTNTILLLTMRLLLCTYIAFWYSYMTNRSKQRFQGTFYFLRPFQAADMRPCPSGSWERLACRS